MLNKKKVLGKGLGALIAGAEAKVEGTEGNYFFCRGVNVSFCRVSWERRGGHPR